MTAIPKIAAHFTTSLANKITASDTSLSLVSATDKAGNALSGLYGFTIDKGSSSEEFMLGTISGTTVTITARGLDPQDGKTEVSALKLAHRRGAPVEITDYPLLTVLMRVVNGDESFPNNLDLGSKKITNLATPTATTDAANKSYVDGVAIAGGADASSTIKGISKLSVDPASPTAPIAVGDNDGRVPTQNENDALVGTSGTAVSSSNKLVDNSDTGTSGANKVLRLDGSGKLPAVDGSQLTGLVSARFVAKTTAISATNDTNENSIFSATITGGTMTSTGVLVFRIPFTCTAADTNATTVTVRLKFGGSTIGTLTLTSPTIGGGTGGTIAGVIEGIIINNSSASSQVGTVYAVSTITSALVTNLQAPYFSTPAADISSSVATGSNQTLQLTVQKNSANTSGQFSFRAGYIAVFN